MNVMHKKYSVCFIICLFETDGEPLCRLVKLVGSIIVLVLSAMYDGNATAGAKAAGTGL